LISSPYDTDARYSTKRDVDWVGYKASPFGGVILYTYDALQESSRWQRV